VPRGRIVEREHAAQLELERRLARRSARSARVDLRQGVSRRGCQLASEVVGFTPGVTARRAGGGSAGELSAITNQVARASTSSSRADECDVDRGGPPDALAGGDQQVRQDIQHARVLRDDPRKRSKLGGSDRGGRNRLLEPRLE
jgi:ribosomal protein S9